LLLNEIERRFSEALHLPLRVDRADAADRARSEIPLDPPEHMSMVASSFFVRQVSKIPPCWRCSSTTSWRSAIARRCRTRGARAGLARSNNPNRTIRPFDLEHRRDAFGVALDFPRLACGISGIIRFDIHFPSDAGKGIGVRFSSEAGVYDISTGPPALLAVNGQIRHIRGASRKQRGEDGAG
jgi:hypothetical protein